MLHCRALIFQGGTLRESGLHYTGPAFFCRIQWLAIIRYISLSDRSTGVLAKQEELQLTINSETNIYRKLIQSVKVAGKTVLFFGLSSNVVYLIISFCCGIYRINLWNICNKTRHPIKAIMINLTFMYRKSW